MRKKSLIRKLFAGFLLIYLVLVIIYFSLSYYVNRQLESRGTQIALKNCSKIWATRGLNTRIGGLFDNANTIEAVNRAFRQGAVGTEIDIFYDRQRQEYIVSHDYPYNLKQGKLLTLAELLKATGHKGYFWLDFKKMRHLSKSVAKEAAVNLRSLVDYYSDNDAVFVEGHDPINLAYFRSAGFQTIFDSHPPPDHWPFTSFVMNIYKMVFYFGDHTVMGIEYDDINRPVFGPDTFKATTNVPLFIYHVPNDRALLKKLSTHNNIKVILDIDDAAAVFDINACQPTKR
ncbi:MAG: hypothetical protein DWP95_03170 [Proteobacteria bacterium]|nr:MAG: hypothetical protein DWP95_03170 [Pseudomonadota bacterium]